MILDIEEIRGGGNENRFERGRRNRNVNYSAPFTITNNYNLVYSDTIEISIYSAFHIRDACSPSLLYYLPIKVNEG